jgi:hypothetical protein
MREGRGDVAAYTGQRRKQAVRAASPLHPLRVVRAAAVGLLASPWPRSPSTVAKYRLKFLHSAQEPVSRSPLAHAGDGHRVDRSCLELSGVYLASGAYRPSHHEADGRTDGSSADPGSPGPTRGKDTSTSYGKDNQKRSSSSAESGVRCPLLFSRTTATLSANFLLPTPSGDQSC